MITAYKKFWANYTNFSGRSSRSDYWWVYLCNTLITLPLLLLLMGSMVSLFVEISPYLSETGDIVGISDEALGALVLSKLFSPATTIPWIILIVYGLATFIPSLSLLVRRLRDGGFHWGVIVLGLIPYIGGLIIFVLTLMPTKQPLDFQSLE